MARELSAEKERIMQPYIERHMYYDYDRQDVVWKDLERTSKRKRNGNRVGEIFTIGGYQYRLTGFSSEGQHTSMLVNRIAWFLVTGDWPDGGLTHKNKDPADVSIDNLVLMSPRTLHILQRLKNDIVMDRIKPKQVGKIEKKWKAQWKCHEGQHPKYKEKRFSRFDEAYDKMLDAKTERIAYLESQGVALSEVVDRLTTPEMTGDQL